MLFCIVKCFVFNFSLCLLQLLKPLHDKFLGMCLPFIAQKYENQDVQMEVLDLIECLTGVLDGCTMSNMDDLMPLIIPWLKEVVKLADVYHNYGVILNSISQMFCVAAKRISGALNQVLYLFAYIACFFFNFLLSI